MANRSPFSQTSRHFFQPLLPGFQSHLNIPVKFFSEYIEGKHEGKTVKLISNASERTWEVKMEDNRLTIGWKEYVETHDLRIGDIVVFRHEGDMLFHVTVLGTSCCEIQYSYSPSRSLEEDEECDETEISSGSEKDVEENVKIESDQSSTDLNCFTQYVTASNLLRDAVIVPIVFVNRNGLNKERQDIVLMNEEGRSWVSELKSYASSRVCIVRGWTSFCNENKLKVGDSCTFKLLPNTKTPVFQLCSRTKAERKRQTRSEEDYIDNKTGENRFLKLTVTPGSLEHGKQHLPVSSTRLNMLNKPGKIILVDKDKVEWPMKLMDQGNGLMYIYSGKGWKSFCAANEVGAGESLTLELIGTSPLLKFCSKMEEPPSEPDDASYKRARVQNLSQETRPKIEIREKADAEGEASRASNKYSGNQNLQHMRPCSVSDQMAKVKQSVVDSLTSIKRFRTELEIMEQKLEVSLQEINNSERREDKWE